MAMFEARGTLKRTVTREVADTRKPIYLVFILDTSGSMEELLTVRRSETKTEQISKIKELNRGFADALASMRKFEKENALYRVMYQIIELNSYGKAVYPTFQSAAQKVEEICFGAKGVTCLENSLSTLQDFLSPKYLPNCKRAVNVILMSDGMPTDMEGYVVREEVYQKTIADFKRFLEVKGLRPNVDLYSIGVGEDACEQMLRSFADENRYYQVGDLESLAEKLDFVTRKSLVRHTTLQGLPYPSAAPKRPAMQEAESSVTREVDLPICLGGTCLACLDVCVHSAIEYCNGMVRISPDHCIGCGVCEARCPVGAIRKTEDADLLDGALS